MPPRALRRYSSCRHRGKNIVELARPCYDWVSIATVREHDSSRISAILVVPSRVCRANDEGSGQQCPFHLSSRQGSSGLMTSRPRVVRVLHEVRQISIRTLHPKYLRK